MFLVCVSLAQFNKFSLAGWRNRYYWARCCCILTPWRSTSTTHIGAPLASFSAPLSTCSSSIPIWWVSCTWAWRSAWPAARLFTVKHWRWPEPRWARRRSARRSIYYLTMSTDSTSVSYFSITCGSDPWRPSSSRMSCITWSKLGYRLSSVSPLCWCSSLYKVRRPLFWSFLAIRVIERSSWKWLDMYYILFAKFRNI